ncbi:MAG: hypothetical protein A3C27_03835 [Candidatus Levybacteria bacterium RIFCSPHIGHO2_02_FULL_39_36]|nr:MAG: hypothetical protein UT20_C0017G0002 [Candidatus Levybacteria bacterium GW2011_GWA1_39_11]KKR24834.1 MAG: hypothetical protein UT56_C0007G0002 [Candidatus Levybacteria bacterium GW2011_GWB1_39_7]KKR50076.1 MAG: hypothetical protein UT85_C0006G0005 [Candidatus Levybacteria bacterium GW2011_GWA2_40_16]OGH15455.1 MAG: hypothetical protein A2689_01980 [Candidatus Levybacteria bacterium RIFCSPHIGHO2_01_FULL_38_96]OGH26007.1 MAG: hypothetical protein A3E68_03150 [Candidatus Levybacteria bacte
MNTNNIDFNNIDKDILREMQKLVLARLKASSDDLTISIGSTEYTKEEMLKSVEEINDLGKEIIEVQIEYLRDMATGAIYQEA